MGKGDARRPTQINDKMFTNGWCLAFGHKMRGDVDVCVNCGKTAAMIAEESGDATISA